METIFIALSNMSGIACASDRDHTLYQLSKKVPLALAVSPSSPIPWDSIIEQYKRTAGLEEKEEFSDGDADSNCGGRNGNACAGAGSDSNARAGTDGDARTHGGRAGAGGLSI